jgi:hypothetical protein
VPRHEDCIDIVGIVAGWRSGQQSEQHLAEKKINRFMRDSNEGLHWSAVRSRGVAAVEPQLTPIAAKKTEYELCSTGGACPDQFIVV